MDPAYHYAYLHGFASSPLSRKGVELRDRLVSKGVELWLPDLNRPSFPKLSHAAMLAHMDRVDEVAGADAKFRIGTSSKRSELPTRSVGELEGDPEEFISKGGGSRRNLQRKKWRLIGSSLGGWLAARWAQLRPRRVDRLVLLCPAFAMGKRWPDLMGAEAMTQWQRDGVLMLPDGSGTPAPLHYAFFEESLGEISPPEVRCPTLIVHGSRDEVVPPEWSRSYAFKRPHVNLVEVDDDHTLMRSLDVIEMEICRHFG